LIATYKSEMVTGRLQSFEHLEHETPRWIGVYSHDRLHEELGDVPPSEYEQQVTRSPTRPCGPLEAARPALHKGAPASLENYEETTKSSL
jgi:hypothetical protein